MAVYRRPGRVAVHRSKVQRPRRRDAAADNLQPKRHIRHRRHRALPHYPAGASANHKPITNRVAQRDERLRPAVMMRHLCPGVLFNFHTVGNIILRDGRLHNLGDGVFLHVLQNWDAPLGVEQRVVVVEGNREPFRCDRVALFGLLPDVKPWPALGFKRQVAVVCSGPGLGGHILRWQVDIPPTHRGILVHLFAKERMHRHIHCPCHRIKQCHLQSCSQLIVPHDGCCVLSLGECHVFILGGAKGVMQ